MTFDSYSKIVNYLIFTNGNFLEINLHKYYHSLV
jgi:hypothetical protein